VWRVDGVAPHGGLGFSVAAAGDVNRDGYSDVLVSTQASNGNNAVYLYLGSANGPVTTPAWKMESYSIPARGSAAGDVNGDGYDDVVFGFAELPPAASGGLVEVRYGHPWGLNDVPEFSESFPTSTGGYSVAAAGDVNGDGYDDVAVGDPTFGDLAPPCQNTMAGRLTVYYGSSSGLSSGNAWRRCGYPAVQGAMAGRTFAGIGDVNGDGYDDVACTYSQGTTWSRVMQFLGSPGGLPPTYPDGIYGPPDSNDPDFGRVIAPAGDVNGDGYADVIIGDPHYGAAASDSGAVYVVPGNATYGMSWSGIIDIGGVVVSPSTILGPAGSR